MLFLRNQHLTKTRSKIHYFIKTQLIHQLVSCGWLSISEKEIMDQKNRNPNKQRHQQRYSRFHEVCTESYFSLYFSLYFFTFFTFSLLNPNIIMRTKSEKKSELSVHTSWKREYKFWIMKKIFNMPLTSIDSLLFSSNTSCQKQDISTC
jgi:hypothetical protein